MEQVERDAKKVGLQLASDPGYRKVAGFFWGGLIVLGIIVVAVSAAVHALAEQWAVIGVAVGALALVVLLVVLANRNARRHSPGE